MGLTRDIIHATPLWGRLMNSSRKNELYFTSENRNPGLKRIQVQACVGWVGRELGGSHPSGGRLFQERAAMAAAQNPEGWEVVE